MKKILTLVACLSLVASLAVGGSIAYLQDQKANVNVMMLGSVEIVQLENGEPDGFSNGVPLYPAFYDGDYETGKVVTGAVNKKVTVKNEGVNQAYIRTVFAFEQGELTAENYQSMIHLDLDENVVPENWIWTGETVTIGDANYLLAYYVYPEAVDRGTETHATLKRIVMDKEAGNKLVKSFGDTYKVYVTSQAVQVDNLQSLGVAGALNEAFGEINANNNPWVGENAEIPGDPDVLIASLADLKDFAAKVNAGDNFSGKTVALGVDIDLGGVEWEPIGNSQPITRAADAKRAIFSGTFDGQGHTIKNFKVNKDAYAGLFGNIQSGTIMNLNVEDVVINANHYAGAVAGHGVCGKVVNCHVKNAVITVAVNQKSDGDWDNGDKVGGVIGFINLENGTCYVKNCSVTNAQVTGYRDIGGVVGYAGQGAAVENCTVDVIKIKQVIEDGKNYKDITMGYHAGDIVGYDSVKNGSVNYEGKNEQTVVATKDADVREALKNGKDVVLLDNVLTTDAESNGNGATGFNVDGTTLDGNGKTIKVEGATSTWDSAVAIKGGTIKNVTIAKGFRGVFVKKGTEKVYLENVIVDGPTYTISCDQAGKQGLEATNCTFNGWTSYAATIGNVLFTNCNFGAGAGYNFSRPYAPTEYVNCNFAKGHKMDPRAAVTFQNCTIAGEPLTAENLATLVTSNIENASVK